MLTAVSWLISGHSIGRISVPWIVPMTCRHRAGTPARNRSITSSVARYRRACALWAWTTLATKPVPGSWRAARPAPCGSSSHSTTSGRASTYTSRSTVLSMRTTLPVRHPITFTGPLDNGE